MNLDDIPEIRKQLQVLYDEFETARSDHISRITSIERIAGKHTETARGKINSDFSRAHENYDIGLEKLQTELFGTDIGSVDISDLLDWIKHFLEATCPKT